MKLVVWSIIFLPVFLLSGMQQQSSGWERSYEQEACAFTSGAVGVYLPMYSCVKCAGQLTGCCNLALFGPCEMHPVTGIGFGLCCLVIAASQGVSRFRDVDHCCCQEYIQMFRRKKPSAQVMQ